MPIKCLIHVSNAAITTLFRQLNITNIVKDVNDRKNWMIIKVSTETILVDWKCQTIFSSFITYLILSMVEVVSSL